MGREDCLHALVLLLLGLEFLAGRDCGLEVLRGQVSKGEWWGNRAGEGRTCLEFLVGVGEGLEALLVFCHCRIEDI